jgi:aspartyl-tRNA(Asn)/glutamyl-tRNA(Gln) amidotransferase subunit A
MISNSINQLRSDIKAKKIKVEDLLQESLANVAQRNSELNAMITVRTEQEVMEDLKQADPNSPLYGIPYAMKDGYVTAGIRTTAASKILDTFVPTYSATVYTKLKAAGAILISKPIWTPGDTALVRRTPIMVLLKILGSL